MERRVLIVFDDMIADVEANSKLSPIVTKLLLRGRKLNISPAFISHSYFKTFKTIRIVATHYFIMKIRLQDVLESSKMFTANICI